MKTKWNISEDVALIIIKECIHHLFFLNNTNRLLKQYVLMNLNKTMK